MGSGLPKEIVGPVAVPKRVNTVIEEVASIEDGEPYVSRAWVDSENGAVVVGHGSHWVNSNRPPDELRLNRAPCASRLSAAALDRAEAPGQPEDRLREGGY